MLNDHHTPRFTDKLSAHCGVNTLRCTQSITGVAGINGDAENAGLENDGPNSRA